MKYGFKCYLFFALFLKKKITLIHSDIIIGYFHFNISENILKVFSLPCRYNVEEEGGCDDLDQGDNGWKIIHTDVFRFPPYKSLLCAVLGVGAQFLTLATGECSYSKFVYTTHNY